MSPGQRSLDVPMCKVTRRNISEEASTKKEMKFYFKVKKKSAVRGDVHIKECIIRGPDGTKYRIRPGVSYGHGKIRCLCDMENVPDNVCGVWIAGFSQREFGRWQFAAKTTSQVEMRREENIEIIEFPCGGPVKPHWGKKTSSTTTTTTTTTTT